MEKSELLPIRRAPQEADRVGAFPDLGPERAFDPHSIPRAPPCDRELTRACPVGPRDVLGELTRNPAHRGNSGQDEMNPAKPEGRRTHQDSKLASLRRDRREQRGPETEWLESRTTWGISVDLFRYSLEGGAEHHPTLRREPRTANVRITEGDAFEGRK